MSRSFSDGELITELEVIARDMTKRENRVALHLARIAIHNEARFNYHFRASALEANIQTIREEIADDAPTS